MGYKGFGCQNEFDVAVLSVTGKGTFFGTSLDYIYDDPEGNGSVLCFNCVIE